MQSKYKPLVVVSPRDPAAAGFRGLLKSFDLNVGTDSAELVVSGRLTAEQADAVLSVGGSVVTSRKPYHPHLWVADFLGRAVLRRQPDRPVLVLESANTVFQTDDLLAYATHDAVSVLAEPWVVAHDVRSREQYAALNRELKPAFRRETFEDVQIISPAVAAGPARLVAMWETARVAIDARGAVTDAGVQLLADWAGSWPWLTLVPATDPWVGHGHWAGVLNVPVDDGVAVCPRTGGPYAIFHDWDLVATAVRPVTRRYL